MLNLGVLSSLAAADLHCSAELLANSPDCQAGCASRINCADPAGASPLLRGLELPRRRFLGTEPRITEVVEYSMVARNCINSDPASGDCDLAADPDLATLVAQFVGELAARFAAIEAAILGRHWEDAHRLAHQLKGAGGCYGLPDITAAAADVEHAIQLVVSQPAPEFAGQSQPLSAALAALRARCTVQQA